MRVWVPYTRGNVRLDGRIDMVFYGFLWFPSLLIPLAFIIKVPLRQAISPCVQKRINLSL